MTYVVHYEPGIAWHSPFAHTIAGGLGRLGLNFSLTTQRDRVSDDCAILLGTTCWREIETTGPYLLVDRCSFGDTNKFVSLGFNGHGRRGDHKVPANYDDSRWKLHGVPLRNPPFGHRVVLCGQVEAYCDRLLSDWYADWHGIATHFRPHPAALDHCPGFRRCLDWVGVKSAITLNSSVAIDAIINGVGVIVDDEGGMAWEYANGNLGRNELMHWLAWTQYSHEEIAEGRPIAHLFR
jgi:hypothetical protein